MAFSLAGVHVARFATDERFVNLHFTAELGEPFGLHGMADTSEHVPCGLLGHAKGAGQFVGADAVLRVHQQPQRGQPLVEAERAILEHGAELGRELTATIAALPDTASRNERRVRGLAGRAGYPVRPAKLSEEVVREVRVSEVLDRFTQGSRSSGGLEHGLKYDQNPAVSSMLVP